MPTWLRSVAGILAGGLNLFANGTNWKQVLASVGVALIGIVSHASAGNAAPETSHKIS
jgi:hypothetical protein